MSETAMGCAEEVQAEESVMLRKQPTDLAWAATKKAWDLTQWQRWAAFYFTIFALFLVGRVRERRAFQRGFPLEGKPSKTSQTLPPYTQAAAVNIATPRSALLRKNLLP